MKSDHVPPMQAKKCNMSQNSPNLPARGDPGLIHKGQVGQGKATHFCRGWSRPAHFYQTVTRPVFSSLSPDSSEHFLVPQPDFR